MKRWRGWLKRGAIAAVAVPVALALVGLTYQAHAAQVAEAIRELVEVTRTQGEKR